jgi:predicted permease
VETLLQDLRFALRTLHASRGFAVVAIITLALGIGVTSTMFSVVNTLLLRPLPFRDAERLVALRGSRASTGGSEIPLSYADFLDWRRRATTLEDAAINTSRDYTLLLGDEPEYVDAQGVSANLFTMLGVAPLIGRSFRVAEDRVGAERVVILSYALWQRRFGTDPKVIGRTVRLDGAPYVVVGVMPPDFNFPYTSQLWTPLALDPTTTRGNRSHEAIGRMKPGVTIDRVQREMATIATALASEYPETNAGRGALVRPYREWVVGDVRSAVLILFGSVGLVLLIACANVGNLMLARAAGREREMALRTALGAARARLIRQLLTESIVLGVAGAAVGALIAVWALEGLRSSLLPGDLPYWWKFEVDGRVLFFTAVIAVLTGVLFGLAPALQGSRADLIAALRDGGRGSSGSKRQRRLRGALVVTEIALSVVLLVGASLMIKSFLRLQRIDTGFDPARVLTMRVTLAGTTFDSARARTQFVQRLLPQVQALPGVQAAGIVSYVPLAPSNTQSTIVVEGRPVEHGSEPVTSWRPVSADYLSTLGIPLVRGRQITTQEVSDSTLVAIVSETMAEKAFGTPDPMGQRFRFGTSATGPWFTVIGVARDIVMDPLDRAPANQAYVPFSTRHGRNITITVRTATSAPAQVAPAVARAVHALDPSLAPYEVRTMDDLFQSAVWTRRLYGWLFATFAAIALVLATVGVYGVISYAVAQRTREMGVRIALGAQRGDVLRLIVGEGLGLAAAGAILGVLAAIAASRLLSGLLVDVSATDPVSFMGVPILLTSVALLASYLPARRATRVDPMEALRSE